MFPIALLLAAAVNLAPGIWVLRHADAPDGFPQGNTTLVVGEEAALVVDSPYLPSAARADIQEIRRLTQKPVKFLLNTHWHPDHSRGNSVYAREFPGLAIIAHQETVKLWKLYEPPNLVRYPQRRAATTDPATAAGMDAVLAELKGHASRGPELGFDGAIEIDLGGRAVQIRHFGRGHTLGDAVAWVPDAQVLATGDALVLPVPYFFNGYPADLAASLRSMALLHARVIVPGHGEVQRDNQAIDREVTLIETVRAKVEDEVARRGSISTRLDDVRKVVDLKVFRAQYAGSDKDRGEEFDEAASNLVRLLFEQAPK